MDLFDPVLYVVEGGDVVDCKGKDDDECASVKSSGEIFELFLPCSVPDLQLDLILLDLQRLHLEVDPNGGRVGGLEAVVAVAQQNVGLPHSAVSDYHCLHHEIAVGLLLRLHLKIILSERQTTSPPFLQLLDFGP